MTNEVLDAVKMAAGELQERYLAVLGHTERRSPTRVRRYVIDEIIERNEVYECKNIVQISWGRQRRRWTCGSECIREKRQPSLSR